MCFEDDVLVCILSAVGLPFTPRYWELYRKRTSLPVWDYKDKFIDTMNKNQCLVLVGETGSGKTTQARRTPRRVILTFLFILDLALAS